jgi:hypothetical protein
MTALAAAIAVAQGISGVSELALYFTPLFLIGALLLCGRFVAENRILRLWRSAVPRRRRRAPRRRRAVAVRPLSSQLTRSSRVTRGPPAPVSA